MRNIYLGLESYISQGNKSTPLHPVHPPLDITQLKPLTERLWGAIGANLAGVLVFGRVSTIPPHLIIDADGRSAASSLTYDVNYVPTLTLNRKRPSPQQLMKQPRSHTSPISHFQTSQCCIATKTPACWATNQMVGCAKKRMWLQELLCWMQKRSRRQGMWWMMHEISMSRNLTCSIEIIPRRRTFKKSLLMTMNNLRQLK